MYNYDLTEELTYVIDVIAQAYGVRGVLLNFDGKQERAVVSYCFLKNEQR